MKLSVVVPVFNAERTIETLVLDIERALSGQDFEIVLVNDGSRDASESICARLAGTRRGRMKFISLRRNFGEHNAVMCGLHYAAGDYVAIVDDDLQNPPAEISKLLAEAEKGYDVVYARYASKRHHWFRNLGSRFNNWVASHLIGKPRDLYLSSFKIIRREVVSEIIKYAGPFPYIDGLILRATDNFSTVDVTHQNRETGKSNYTLSKLVGLYLSMFLNFSIRPLRIFTLAGFGMFMTGTVSAVVFVVWKILVPETAVGWTSIIVAILTFSGFQVMFLGLIGEYLGKQYLDQNKTPQWVVKKEWVD